MRSASVQEIKQELGHLKPAELVNVCLRLVRFKKENKELLTFLLFEAQDEAGYIQEVKDEIDLQMEDINRAHLYFVKKSLRKILRIISKHVRYIGNKQAEADLLLHFCVRFKEMGISYEQSPMLLNLYNGQIRKLRASIKSMHEDLQYDYLRKLEEVEK